MITSLNHITLAVTDLERSFAFYQELLGFRPLVKWDKGAYFDVGGFWFCLNQDDKRIPSECYTHYAFTVSVHDFETRVQRLQEACIPSFKKNTSPGESFYFLDPDGHKLELHVGNAESRIAVQTENAGSWKNVIWYV